jgi:hypothetical protein
MALPKKTTVYEARRPGAIAVAPVVTLHGGALAASVRFQGFAR